MWGKQRQVLTEWGICLAAKNIKKRFAFLLAVFTFIIIGLLVKVIFIQFVDGRELQSKATVQQASAKSLEPQRGNIYDSNGNVLAASMPVETVVASPKDISKTDADTALIADRLGNILGADKDELAAKLRENSYYEILKRKVDKSTAVAVRSYIKENKIPGIYLVGDSKRYYPVKNLAAQVIGFTGSDGQGLQGIEKSMEKYLKGLPGKINGSVDAGGGSLPVQTKNNIEAQDGLNVVLTIDSTIQHIADKALDEAIKQDDVTGGAVAVVMDPKNGDILAMVSKPDYDPNEPYKAPAIPGIDPAGWKGNTQKDVDILNGSVWRNKAISDTYEPGSTFKAITAAAALEEGRIRPDDPVDDSPIRIGNWTFESSPGYVYEGDIPFRRGIYKSSNPVIIRAAQKIGISTFYDYVRAFGFFDRTGINLPGEQNSLFQKKPTEIDMAAAAFGQRFTVTPIQMAAAYTALANGGKLMKPRIVKELTNQQGNAVKKFEPEIIREVISGKTSKTLREILEGVVSEGTGKKAYVEGYRVAGKTGTSETTQSDVYIASFFAFAPADDPVVVVMVALYNPGGNSHMGSDVAAPIAGSIIKDTLDYLGARAGSQYLH